jgi:hypothetical protein
MMVAVFVSAIVLGMATAALAVFGGLRLRQDSRTSERSAQERLAVSGKW